LTFHTPGCIKPIKFIRIIGYWWRNMKLSKEIVDLLKARSPGLVVTYLITASGRGVPNLLPVPFSDVVQDELVLLPDLFAQKTKVNLNENNRVSLSFAGEGRFPFVLEGIADIIQWGHPGGFKLFGLKAGEVLSRWGDWDEHIEPVIDSPIEELRPTVYAQRGVIVFKPERIREEAA
jgi:hypothetical protein